MAPTSEQAILILMFVFTINIGFEVGVGGIDKFLITVF